MPGAFEAPLAAHHRAIGRWAAPRDPGDALYSRQEAQLRIERLFDAEVMEILRPVELVTLRVCALLGTKDDCPPALALSTDDVGRLDLRWIEETSALQDTLFGRVAPVGWRATAYKALEETLGYTLPVFTYVDLLEEISMYYWDGETDDEGARKALCFFHGADDEETIEAMLPSAMHANRPDFMLAENTTALKNLPRPLAARLRRVRETHKALRAIDIDRRAWRYDQEELLAYRPEVYDYSTLPPLTLVPWRHFARELDDVGRQGMECGFVDVAGLMLLPDPAAIDDWFTSLRLGAEYLVAVQDLINLDPSAL